MKIEYTLEILSDAEPGTGLGGEIINACIPRDRRGYPFIPASHLKGLLRDGIRRLSRHLPELTGAETACFGTPGPGMTGRSSGGQDSRCIFSDATRSTPEKSQSSDSGWTHDTVTRTAIDPVTGRALDGSLRTNEIVPAGTVFQGSIQIRAEPGSQAERAVSDAVKVAILSLQALGGGRTRGCGQCIFHLTGEEDGLPGDRLRDLIERNYPWSSLSETAGEVPESKIQTDTTVQKDISIPTETAVREDRCVTVRLVFRAENPVGCPEVPVRTGSIRTGFASPATSV
ncbi:MAG: RAMP superfamily CRISPR-associated protein, partial [Planctomycetia bacterium]|nr:RAMP superfamily CRISPR-associated protein [Planctomycetia bacterium]